MKFYPPLFSRGFKEQKCKEGNGEVLYCIYFAPKEVASSCPRTCSYAKLEMKVDSIQDV